MARLRSNNVFGTSTNVPLTAAGTTLTSDGLANLAVVASPDVAVLTLDPNRVNGAPEIVYVTAHASAAGSATILRGQEGTVAREHPSGTFWVHAATALDVERVWDPPACRVFNSAAQSLADSTFVFPTFNSERFDTDSMHSTVSNTGRITFNTAGVYVVTFSGELTLASDYLLIEISLRLNGATIIASQSMKHDGVSTSPVWSLATIYKFAQGDYVEPRVYQDNTANAARNLVTLGNRSPEFAAAWIGSGD